MKTAVRRRLALGALATSGALVAGLVVAPMALAGSLTISPTGAENTETARDLTFNTTDANLAFGGTATFTRQTTAATFTVSIDPQPSINGDGTGTEDFTDEGDGVGSDGPADAGTYSVSVTDDGASIPVVGSQVGGTDTCTGCFTVLSPGRVAVTAVTPSSLRPNQTANVTVNGNNFERGSRIEVLNLNGTPDTTITTNLPPRNANNAVVNDNITTRTQLQRQFAVAPGAIAGARDVRVTNVDGNTATCPRCFFVAGASLTSVTPVAAANNDPGQTDTTLTFSGPSVVNGDMFLEFLGASSGGATRSSLTLTETTPASSTSNGTSITGTFTFSNAAPGVYQPVVRSSDGIVNACDSCRFTVIQRAERTPTVTSLDETGTATGKSQPAGTTRTFDVLGTNFSKGAAVVVSGAGVTTTAVEFVSPTLLRATFSSTAAAATGNRNVTVTLTDGKTATCTGCYTVAPVNSGSNGSATATATVDFVRLAGNDRYATAAQIATTPATATATTVVLANGQSDDPRTSRNENHFPDALAGAYLAGNRNAPTLLATETSVPQPTLDAIDDLGARNIVIVGGTSAIGAGVEKQLRDAGFTVTRVAGPTRYDTARAVATTPPDDYVGSNPSGERTAIVANGQNFPDALVSGPLGYRSRFPVLITTPGSLSSQTRAALQELGIERVLIAGGTAAVSQATEDQIKALRIATTRLSGPDKTATAVAISRYAYDTLGFDRTHVNLARGDAFPDALAGGPHGGKENAPILLTVDASTLGTPTRDFLRARSAALRTGHILGGTSAVTTSVERDAEAATTRQAS